MKLQAILSGRKPAPRVSANRRQHRELRNRLVLILLRDLIPTAIILLTVGWISLHIAAFIAKDKPASALPSSLAVTP